MNQILIQKKKSLKLKLNKEVQGLAVTLLTKEIYQAGKGKPIGSLNEVRRQALTSYRLTNLHLSTCFARLAETQALNKV